MRYQHFCVSNSATSHTYTTTLPPLTPNTLVYERQSSSRPFDTPASEILPYLIMSNEKDAHDPNFISSHAITHVLNLTCTPCSDEVLHLAKCHTIPLTDTTSQDILAALPTAIEFIGLKRLSSFHLA